MIGYKVFRSSNNQLFSVSPLGWKIMCGAPYKEDDWNTAPVGGFLIFDSAQRACDFADMHIRGGEEVAKVEYEDIIPTPPRLIDAFNDPSMIDSLQWFAAGIAKDTVWAPYGSIGDFLNRMEDNGLHYPIYPPRGTIAAKKVRILRRLTSEELHAQATQSI